MLHHLGIKHIQTLFYFFFFSFFFFLMFLCSDILKSNFPNGWYQITGLTWATWHMPFFCRFKHPRTGEYLRFSCLPPDDFAEVLDQLQSIYPCWTLPATPTMDVCPWPLRWCTRPIHSLKPGSSCRAPCTWIPGLPEAARPLASIHPLALTPIASLEQLVHVLQEVSRILRLDSGG